MHDVRRLIALAPFAAAALLTSPAATAQSWSGGGCSGCHGTPPTIASSVGNGACNNYTIGVNEGFLGSAADLLARVNAAGAACGVAQMQAANFTNAASVFAYLTNLHHGTVSGSAPSIGSSKVGVAKDVAFTFTLTNYRDAATSYTVTTSGGNSSEFDVISFSASGTGCSGSTLPAATTEAGANCTVSGTVRFTPSTTGARSTTLVAQLTSTPSGLNRSVYGLSGTGVRPNFAVSPNTPQAFSAKVGTTVQRTFTISNSGTVALNLTSISVSPAPYARNGGTCTTAFVNDVPAGDSCTVVVEFSPGAAGAAPAGTLSIGHDGGNVSSPATVSLSGTGTVPTISASTPALDFGNAQLGVPKVLNGAVTLTNTGDATLVFPANPFGLSGANPGDFSFAGTCGGASVAPGDTCTVDATFTPGAVATRSATLTINSDATNAAPAVTLEGEGVALPEPVLTFPATDFPDTVIGATAAQTRQVTIVNDRTLDIGYSVASTTDFNVQSESCPTQVVPGGGGSCTVTWRFQPQLAGGETRRTANVTFSFTGTGGNAAPSDVVGGLAGRALLPLGAPAALAPSAGFGLPSTTSTLLTNRSAAPITVSALAFSGTAAADYALDASNGCAVGAPIGAGNSCTLVVRFNPSAGGTRSATLTITHDAIGSPQQITLNGSATQASIQLSSFALTYPDTALNANAAQSITVQNGGTQPLNFSAFNLAGAAAGDYTRGGTCVAGTPLAVGASCELALTFQPSALGTRSASLTIMSDASNGPATVTMSGTGVPIPAPVVTLAPTSLDFGEQTVGNALYPARTIRLSNTGNAPLASIVVGITGNAYATASTCPPTLAPGAGCDIAIRFTPTAANTDYAGTLRVTSNGTGSPHAVALSGRGTAAVLPVLVWSPAVTELDFGTVSAGTVSAPQTATLSNQGPGGVTLTLLNAIGPNAANFGVVGGTCAVGMQLFEGQSCTVQFGFAPASAGVRRATVQVASSGSFPPTLALVGTGSGGPTPAASLSSTALDLGEARVGSRSLPGEITITSSGSGTLHVTALAVDGPFAVQGGSCPALPYALPAGSSCTVAVLFQPQAEGGATGTLSVTTDVPGAALEVALSGEGEPKADVSSGGCSMIDGDSATDPTLWALVLLAVVALARRRWVRRA
jgi:MYXO-CTERM domain-containing protein